MHISNNQNQTNFKGLSTLKTPLQAFYNKNATIPTLIVETGVTLGRSHEAKLRGGKIEQTERLVEQGIGALVWVYGVQFLNKIIDNIGSKLFKIPNLDFDIGYDALRNPIKNNKISKNVAFFKSSNILLSTLFATYFIGFILPKINHKITNKMLKSDEKKLNNENKTNKTLLKPISLDEYKNNLQKPKKNNLDIAFTNGFKDNVISLSHALENTSSLRLFITDFGVISGRFKNGRDKYEKIEGLFRDITSIYFYLLSPIHVNKLCNKIFQNKDLNPSIIESTINHIKSIAFNNELQNKNGFSPMEFKSYVDSNIKQSDLDKLNNLFKNKKVINVDDFINEFKELNLSTKAFNMAKLQPIFEGNGVLSYMEAYDTLSHSILSEPEFLKKTLSKATKGVSDDKMKFIKQSKLEDLRNQIDEFVDFIIKKAQKENKNIDLDFIMSEANKNIKKSFLFHSLGIVSSIFALGFLIPKIQYFITRVLKNNSKDENKKAN